MHARLLSSLSLLTAALLLSAPLLAAEAPLDVRLNEWIGGAVSQGSFLLAVLIAFAAGVVVSLSPCVYPLIPITIAVFGARQAEGYLKGFLLSLCYVLGMALFYSGTAILFSLLGLASGSLMAIPAVVLTIAGLGALMAVSLFGVFELVLPASLQTKLSAVGGAGYRGAFLMGLVAGIIAAPCAGPVLVFILALIAKEGSPVLGVSLMIAYALGIGMLFLILGTFSQLITRMPKSGAWMEIARSVLGLGMLVAALYIAAPHLPPVRAFMHLEWSGSWAIAALVAIALGVALGALHLSFRHQGALAATRKGIGIALGTLGLLGLVAFADRAPAPDPGRDTGAPALVWHSSHESAKSAAKVAGKPLMIDFGAEWCHACKELERHTFTTPEFEAEAARFVLARIDCTELTDEISALWERYGISGLPNVVFIDSQGRLLEDPRVTGFLDTAHFVPEMKKVK